MPFCVNNFINSPRLAFYRILKTYPAAFSFRLFWLHGKEASKEAISEAVSRRILLVFLEVKLPLEHPPPSASHFHVFSFNSTFRFAILSCFIPAETFHFAFRHVCLHLRSPNNPINVRAPSLEPRLLLFSEVSYKQNLRILACVH